MGNEPAAEQCSPDVLAPATSKAASRLLKSGSSDDGRKVIEFRSRPYAGLPRGIAMTKNAERRLAHEQALASTRISGHVPSPEFLADCEAVTKGTMTNEEARARSLARALAKDKAAADSAPASGE